jgi:DNA-binding MarR family transcriptional regulator
MISDELLRAALEIRVLSMSLFRVATRALEQHPQLAKEDITVLQYGVLRALCHKALTISELSQWLMVDPSTLVPVIDTLERKGMVKRQRDQSDRRRVPLSVTERGNAIVACVPAVDEGDPLVCSLRAMGEQDAGHFLRLMRELIRNIPEGEEILRRVSERVRLHQMPPSE